MTTPPTRTWLLLAPALALLLLAAHFYRAAEWPWVLASLALLPMLALRRAWVPRVLQLALLVGAIEWVWTAALLAQQRLALGQPWLRMACILGAVALLTLAAAGVFRSAGLKARYGSGRAAA
ncbi:MAG: hypothetical protein Q7U73_07290 [Rubrivivax sp.]|nr:hypothetical protein [Rubrivivax sp.]